LSLKYQVSRRTVRSALQSAWPPPRKPLPPRPSKLDPFKAAIDEILRADLVAPRKQRHTVNRIFDRLRAEHGMVDVSYPVVRAYVAVRKPAIRAEAGQTPLQVFFPQTHRPGEEAEVDLRRRPTITRRRWGVEAAPAVRLVEARRRLARR
jgi:hypothetical protein